MGGTAHDAHCALRTGHCALCALTSGEPDAAAIPPSFADFDRLMSDTKDRRDAVVAEIHHAYRSKRAVFDAQVQALDEAGANSEAALQLVEVTLAAATPAHVLERSQLFMSGKSFVCLVF